MVSALEVKFRWRATWVDQPDMHATDGVCMVLDSIGRVHYVPHKSVWQWSVTDHTRRIDNFLWAGKLSGEAATKEEAQRLVEERWRLATGN